MTADFVSCGRCSFFLAGYRVLQGLDALQQAAEQRDEAWLVLRWNHAMRKLVQDSYGSRMDIEFYYYDGRCPECQRRFVIGQQDEPAAIEAEGEEEPGDSEQAWQAPEPDVLRVALNND